MYFLLLTAAPSETLPEHRLCHCDMSCGLSNRFGQCWLIDLSVCVMSFDSAA